MENIINDLNQVENAIKTLESKRDELKTKLEPEIAGKLFSKGE